MSVPKVRDAVHKVTAPREYALPKTRERLPAAEPLSLAAAPCPSIASPLIDHGFIESDPETYVATKLSDPPLTGSSGGGSGPITPPPPGGGGGGAVPEPHSWLQMMIGFILIG